MAHEPKENQFKWFVKLVETQGLEAANKYTEILRQFQPMEPVHTMGKPITMSNSQQTPSLSTLGPNIDMAFDTLLSGPAPILSDLLIGTKDGNASLDANPFPLLPVNSSMSNRNGHRNNMLNMDMVNAHSNTDLTSMSAQQMMAATSHAPASSELFRNDAASGRTLDKPLPLYRRQAGQGTKRIIKCYSFETAIIICISSFRSLNYSYNVVRANRQQHFR